MQLVAHASNFRANTKLKDSEQTFQTGNQEEQESMNIRIMPALRTRAQNRHSTPFRTGERDCVRR